MSKKVVGTFARIIKKTHNLQVGDIVKVKETNWYGYPYYNVISIITEKYSPGRQIDSILRKSIEPIHDFLEKYKTIELTRDVLEYSKGTMFEVELFGKVSVKVKTATKYIDIKYNAIKLLEQEVIETELDSICSAMPWEIEKK